jgi:hypothetical protein
MTKKRLSTIGFDLVRRWSKVDLQDQQTFITIATVALTGSIIAILIAISAVGQ